MNYFLFVSRNASKLTCSWSFRNSNFRFKYYSKRRKNSHFIICGFRYKVLTSAFYNQLTLLLIFFFVFSCIFSSYHEKATNAFTRACLGVASHLSTTPRWGNPAKSLFQRHNKQTCRLALYTVPLMLSVKQVAVNTNFKAIGLTRLGIKLKSTVSGADALTTRPSEPLYLVKKLAIVILRADFLILNYFLQKSHKK